MNALFYYTAIKVFYISIHNPLQKVSFDFARFFMNREKGIIRVRKKRLTIFNRFILVYMKYLLILLFVGTFTTANCQVKLTLEEKEIKVNGTSVSKESVRAELEGLIGTKSSYGYIVGSYNPSTKEESSIKRRSYRFKQSGISFQYYAKEPGIYSIFLEFRSSHQKPSKNNKVVYPNSFTDGDIVIDSSTTHSQALAMIGKDKLIKNGEKPFYKTLAPYLLYAKNDLLVDLIFDPNTKRIKLVSIKK